MRCHFLAWTYPSFDFQTASLQTSLWALRGRTPRAQSAAPQMRLRDAYPVIPPTPLFPRRLFLRCAPVLAPVFQAPEKPAQTIHSEGLAGVPGRPTNEFSRWALPADAPA